MRNPQSSHAAPRLPFGCPRYSYLHVIWVQLSVKYFLLHAVYTVIALSKVYSVYTSMVFTVSVTAIPTYTALHAYSAAERRHADPNPIN